MRARTTFTLIISLASLMSVVFYSIHLFSELREEVYELIDIELEQAAEAIFKSLAHNKRIAADTTLDSAGFFLSGYWLRVSGSDNRPLFISALASKVTIPPPAPQKAGKAYMVTLPISLELLSIPESEKEDIVPGPIDLRARVFTRQIGGEQVSVHIARPMHLIKWELLEIFKETSSSFLLTILVIMVLSYLVAGRILRPLAQINQRITRIREHSLHERIPLHRSRDEFHSLITALNSMFDRLQHSFARQREFIGNAAHEMKSPLTILMLGHEEMLATGLDPEVQVELEKQLQTMQRLNKLIRDLLSIARLEQEDTLAREPVDLAGMLSRIIEDYREVISARAIAVEMKLKPMQIQVDRDKVQRLFINLIDNGIKYNLASDGILRITGALQQKTASIEITNTGATIPAPDLDLVFKQFHRVEKSRATAFGGTGLGLTIAQRIARMHGGDISVTSNGGLTTFTVWLPISEPIPGQADTQGR